jgi:hypothetical protein
MRGGDFFALDTLWKEVYNTYYQDLGASPPHWFPGRDISAVNWEKDN